MLKVRVTSAAYYDVSMSEAWAKGAWTLHGTHPRYFGLFVPDVHEVLGRMRRFAIRILSRFTESTKILRSST